MADLYNRLNTLFDLVSSMAGLGGLFYSKISVDQANSLHRKELAASMATHFQQLSHDLFAAAKEADRDVWEQYNGRFNNLMLLTVLMLSVTVSLVTEGTFEPNASSAALSIMFMLGTAVATALFVACLTASMVATRQMSTLMSDRSAILEERIVYLASRNQLSGEMHALYRKIDNVGQQQAFTGNVDKVPSRASLAAEITSASLDNLSSPIREDVPVTRRDGMRFADFVQGHIKWLEEVAMATFFMGTISCFLAITALVINHFAEQW